MQRNYLLLPLVIFLITACGGGTSISNESTEEETTDGQNTETGTDTAEVEDIQSLVSKYAGATFVSVETLETGPTPTGVSMGNWTVSFANDVVMWNYSDVIETGTYALDAGANPIASFSGRDITFSGDGVSLNWDSRTYRRLEPSVFDSQQALINYFDGSTYVSIEELDVGETALGTVAMGNWSLRFESNNVDWFVQDTVQAGSYRYRDGSSFEIDFGVDARTAYVLTGDELLLDTVIYRKDAIGQFDSQETLVRFLSGTTYQSATLEQVGPVSDGIVAVGNWFLDFREDTFVWNTGDAEESGTYAYVAENTFSAIFPDRTLTIEIDASGILWDGVRYIKQ